MKDKLEYPHFHFEQLIWRTVGPIHEQHRMNHWQEIKYEKAAKLLEEFDGKPFEEVIYHYERNNCIDIYQRKSYSHFQIKNSEFDLRKLVGTVSHIFKTIIKKNDDYLEVRFIFRDGRLDLGFKNMIHF